MSIRRRKLNRKLEELKDQAQEASEALVRVEAREAWVLRFADEMREVRRENNFTQLFLEKVGAQRR